MTSHDELVGNPKNDNSAYCFANPGEIYLAYLPNGGERELDLSAAKGDFTLQWFNPRDGGALTETKNLTGNAKQTLTAPDNKHDWLAIIRK